MKRSSKQKSNSLRVHHASNARYLDRNHAGIFIIGGRLFGTYEEETEPPIYGLTTNINTYNLLNIVSHEYLALWKDIKRSPNFKTKLKYALFPPGWSHDRELSTSKEMRRKQGLN